MGICTAMFPFSENTKQATEESWNQYLLTNHGPLKQISSHPMSLKNARLSSSLSYRQCHTSCLSIVGSE